MLYIALEMNFDCIYWHITSMRITAIVLRDDSTTTKMKCRRLQNKRNLSVSLRMRTALLISVPFQVQRALPAQQSLQLTPLLAFCLRAHMRHTPPKCKEADTVHCCQPTSAHPNTII